MEAVEGRGIKTRFLFVCVENAGRSQMAEAFARRAGLDASSAGTVPASSVNRAVVEAMASAAQIGRALRPSPQSRP